MVANGVPGLALAVTRGTRVTHLRGYGDAGDGRRRLPRDDAAPAEQHRRAGGQPADGQTGERAGDAFHYFDPNYAVLARLVEVVSGRPLSAYLRAHLFAPLAMMGSTSVVTTALAPSAAPGPGPGSIVAVGAWRLRRLPRWRR